jgi:O-methyltransferase involved in polyketide biosynthesis
MKELKGVANTLFVPLAARIAVSKQFPEYFYDEKALDLDPIIPNDLRQGISEYSNMASASRYYQMDKMVKAFMAKHVKANIIFLGAGLETAYFRLFKASDHAELDFYEIDLPEAIKVRQELLGIGEREHLIAADVFKMTWLEGIDHSLPTLLVASGLFQYFHEEDVLKFIKTIKSKFPKGELIFDAVSETGLKYSNRFIKRTGNKDALMHFYVNDATAFSDKTDTALLAEKVFFSDVLQKLGKKLKWLTRLFMRITDQKKRLVIVHLSLN